MNGVSPKENGSHFHKSSSYSVETPYGFHLDLDFLKYVDDIEKGNTIRRIAIQRRPRRRSSSNLLRNLSLPGYGCRSLQWNSASPFFPQSRLADSTQNYKFQSANIRPPAFTKPPEPSHCSVTAQLEAAIKAFDEQPLGQHVRPNLLRASSLPITVLLRKYSESTEDPTSPSGSQDYLAQENGSSEDVFQSQERKTRGFNGTIQQLTAALQRVGELEEEIRIIPELKAQICVLQEERERLLHTFQTDNNSSVGFAGPVVKTSKIPDSPAQSLTSPKNQSKPSDDWMNREYDKLEKNVKASSDAIEIQTELPGFVCNLETNDIPRDNRNAVDHQNPDESLITHLQKQIASLEQKLHHVQSDLEKTRLLLTEQTEQSRLKDARISELIQSEPNVWVVSDRTAAPQNQLRNASELEALPGSPLERTRKSESSVQTQAPERKKTGEGTSEQERKPSDSKDPNMEVHVRKVKELLHQQWECLHKMEGTESMLSPHVCSIQEQLVSLINILTLSVSPTGNESPSAQESMMSEETFAMKTWERSAEETTGDSASDDGDRLQTGTIPEKKSEPTQETNVQRLEDAAVKTTVTDHALQVTKSEEHLEENIEASCPDDHAVKDEEMSFEEAPSQGSRGREPNDEFIQACCFLENHMDEVSEPSDEMGRALTVVFQQWFHVAAEENSCADSVALYLRQVAKQSPAVLQFLVNMVDDNGNSALHYSVSHSNFSIVKLLLDTGVCDVDLKNKVGYTAIMLASLSPVEGIMDINVAQRLMELGDVNARAGQVGQTALHLAVRHGRASTVRLLLANGANINAQDQAGTTALISACDRGHIDIVRILLEDPDCDINLTDKGGRSALSLATQASHTEIADLLRARSGTTKGHDKCKMS